MGAIFYLYQTYFFDKQLSISAQLEKTQKPFTRIFISWPSGMFLTTEWGQKAHTVYLKRILKIYYSADNAYKLTEY